MYVVMGNDEDGLQMGEMKLILVHCYSSVYFVLERQQAVQLVDLGIHCLTGVAKDSKLICIKHENRLDYNPIVEYKVLGKSLMILHHCFPLL